MILAVVNNSKGTNRTLTSELTRSPYTCIGSGIVDDDTNDVEAQARSRFAYVTRVQHVRFIIIELQNRHITSLYNLSPNNFFFFFSPSCFSFLSFEPAVEVNDRLLIPLVSKE